MKLSGIGLWTIYFGKKKKTQVRATFLGGDIEQIQDGRRDTYEFNFKQLLGVSIRLEMVIVFKIKDRKCYMMHIMATRGSFTP